MAELSPYLNSSPTDRAFALGQTSRLIRVFRGTNNAVELIIRVNGRPVYTSGLLREESFNDLEQYTEFYRGPKDKVRMDYYYTRFFKQFPYQIRQRVPYTFPPPVNGRVRVLVSGKRVLSSGVRGKAYNRVVRLTKSPYQNIPRKTQSSTLRPSPEVVNSQFLRTAEAGIGGVRTSFTQTVVPVLSYFREWTGSRTPNWGRLKPGQYPVNGHYARIAERTIDKYTKYQVQPASGNWELNVFPFTEVYSPLPPPLSHLDEAEFKAINKLIAKAQTGIQANLNQNLAQISQLTSLIFVNATKITKSIKQLKRGNLVGAYQLLTAGRKSPPSFKSMGVSTAKSVAQNWLQLQYGWKPLLSDIEGTLLALTQLQTSFGFVQSARATATSAKVSVFDYPPGNPLIGESNSGKTTFTQKTSVKIVVRFKIAEPLKAFMGQTGFTNPVNLVWEILPFSFVVDWFVPVGAYLEALSAWSGAVFLAGTKTHFTRVRTDSAISYGGTAVSEPSVVVNINGNFQQEQTILSRQVLTDFPQQIYPPFRPNPFEKDWTRIDGDGNNRAANAIAILTQAFKT